jgi:hypothetical protein
MKLNKIKSVLKLFNHGQVVANPEAWKKGQVTTNVLIGFIWSLFEVSSAYGFAISIPIDAEIVDGSAIAILAISNWVFTLVSSDKIGVDKKIAF